MSIPRLIKVVLVPVAAAAVALAAGFLFLQIMGYPAVDIFSSVYRESFSDPYGFSHVLRYTSLLTLAGLAVALGFRAGLFNIGVEGQVVIGGLAVAVGAHYLLGSIERDQLKSVPWLLLALGSVLIAMVGGALWGAIPGALKAFSGAHEVITTIMLNFIALALVNYMLRPGSDFAASGRMQTPRLPKDLRWPRAQEVWSGIDGSTLNAISLLAPLACLIVWVILRFTWAGYKLRAAGSNPEAAAAAGISNKAVAVATMAGGGAVAGLIGLEHVLGQKGYMEEGFSGGIGFIGIAVALLGRNHPFGVICAALLFGVLDYGRVVVGGIVPGDIFTIMQAVVILTVLAGSRWIK